MKRITFPTANSISPGHHEIRFEDEIEVDVWWMGNLIETKIEKQDGFFTIDVEDPGKGNRGSIDILDRTFTIIRDDDEDFWGPGGKEGFLTVTKEKHIRTITALAEAFGWDLDADFNPLPGAVVFSKSELESQNKTLMAHIMAELKIFPSVGQARKNGWDKPIEIGDFTVTKKKIRFKVVE